MKNISDLLQLNVKSFKLFAADGEADRKTVCISGDADRERLFATLVVYLFVGFQNFAPLGVVPKS